jgi:hypothetical protein
MTNRWILGGLVVGAAALTVYFVVAEKKTKDAPAAAHAEVPSAGAPVAPTPVVLPAVVDVLDIDPLLDPPPIPPAEPAPPGVVVTALDDEPPAVAVAPVAAPPAIPPAVE